MRYVAEYSEIKISFDCALGGPFDDLRCVSSQLCLLSVTARNTVISTSTVYSFIKLYLSYGNSLFLSNVFWMITKSLSKVMKLLN